MKCVNCGSENVSVQVVTETKLKTKHHGILYWLFIGWWWIPVKWILFTVPALIFKIFCSKKQEAITKEHTKCVCQSCGKVWEI